MIGKRPLAYLVSPPLVATALLGSALLAPRAGNAQGSAQATSAEACLAAHVDGQKLRAKGALGAAREKLLACAQASCPSAVTSDCIPWLAEVEAALPTVVLRARDEKGRDVDQTTVTEGGKPLATHLDGKELSLDPGPHLLRFAAPGRQAVETRVVLAVREKARLVDAVLLLPPSPPATPSPPPATERGISKAGLAFAGAAVLFAGAGTYFGLSARQQLEDARGSCAPRCPAGTRDDAHRAAVFADVSFAVALVSAGASTYFFLRPTPSSTVSFVPLPQGGLSTYGATF